MKKLILLGNGFDISNGLNTRYGDFILNYLYKCLYQLNISDPLRDENNSSLFYLEYNDPLIRLETEKWTDSEGFDSIENLKIKNWFENFLNPNEWSELLEKIENSDLLKIEFRYPEISFLRRLKEVNLYGWIDLEQLYYNSLCDILETNVESVDNFNSQWEFLRKELFLYIKSVENDYVNSHTVQKNFNTYKENNIFKYLFDDYSFLDPSKRPDWGLYDIINFNYTTYVQKLFGWFEDFPLIQIHNSINESDEDIIFGYGNESHPLFEQIRTHQNNSFVKHIKQPMYLESEKYTQIKKLINRSSFEVRIVGLSCGESDRTFLSEIFESRYCEGISIYHKDRKNYKEILRRLYSYKNYRKFQNKINSYDIKKTISQFNLDLSKLTNGYIINKI